MGNHLSHTPETGFLLNQDRTEDFVFTHNNLSVPSLNNSIGNNDIPPPLNAGIIWNQEPIFNNRRPEPQPERYFFYCMKIINNTL